MPAWSTRGRSRRTCKRQVLEVRGHFARPVSRRQTGVRGEETTGAIRGGSRGGRRRERRAKEDGRRVRSRAKMPVDAPPIHRCRSHFVLLNVRTRRWTSVLGRTHEGKCKSIRYATPKRLAAKCHRRCNLRRLPPDAST